MRTDNQRRSDNFEDRGRGSGGGGGGGLPAAALFSILRRIGIRGVLIVGVVLAGVYFFAPPSIKQMIFGALLGGVPGQTQSATGEGSVCDTEAQACDFSRAILGSTEDVWRAQFQQGRLPNYGVNPGAYRDPTLVVFSGAVATGCGNASSDVGPFYCPADTNLYIDPSFYQVMQDRLRAPGDFAQAYVIAHEVGHHVQNLIGATQRQLPGENQNQTSVRVELQADCFAGVWGHTARADLAIDEADLREALNAAHAIGDDALGHSDERQFTHGSSAQRMRWFRRGFDSGDARQCDTFAVSNYGQL
ncbi:KPN_02809 family neutral zinc metallopeptidase [Vitreimonas sp.]|jgi:predicted metalloprotease|uniref:KPN_02809 family neutral zinc metallopeptidase n=1 Tax=Vitreimonas sp. TaxID=3069702 RepID=UPI002EDB1EBF